MKQEKGTTQDMLINIMYSYSLPKQCSTVGFLAACVRDSARGAPGVPHLGALAKLL